MKKTPLLNAELSHIVATMGHTDGLCLADAGLPIPRAVAGPRRIDLAVSPSLPSFVEVLDVILTELVVEHIVLAEEIRQRNPKILEAVLKRFVGVKLSYIPHEEFKKAVADVRAVVRTGECSPYANIILHSGVVF